MVKGLKATDEASVIENGCQMSSDICKMKQTLLKMSKIVVMLFRFSQACNINGLSLLFAVDVHGNDNSDMIAHLTIGY